MLENSFGLQHITPQCMQLLFTFIWVLLEKIAYQVAEVNTAQWEFIRLSLHPETNSPQAAQGGCGVSFSGDIQDPPGQGPVQLAVGDPASAGGLD